MIVVLCIGLVISNILRQGIEIRVIPDGASIKEGLTTEEGMKESISTLEESDELLIKEDSKKVDTAKDEKSTEKKEVKSDSDEVKPADEDALKEKQQEYKKLLELQNELIKGVSTMTPLLKEAKETFDKIKGMQ